MALLSAFGKSPEGTAVCSVGRLVGYNLKALRRSSERHVSLALARLKLYHELSQWRSGNRQHQAEIVAKVHEAANEVLRDFTSTLKRIAP